MSRSTDRSDLPIDDDVAALATRLSESRPLPSPSFRGRLGQDLANTSGRRSGASRQASPGSVRQLIAGYAATGLILLSLAAIGLSGIGPLAA